MAKSSPSSIHTDCKLPFPIFVSAVHLIMVAPLMRRVASDAVYLYRSPFGVHSARSFAGCAVDRAPLRYQPPRHHAFPATATHGQQKEKRTRSISQDTKHPTAWTPVPYVQEQIGGIHHTVDLFSRLLKERIICLNGQVEDQTANVVVASLLFLEADNPEKVWCSPLVLCRN